MYRKIVESKKTGPMTGMSPSSGILIAEKVCGELSVFWCVVSARSYRYPVSPEASRFSTTPRTIWSTR